MPAVAVIRKRLVLFIFNRFKGYLDGISSPKRDTNILEFNVRKYESTVGVEIKFYNTKHGTGLGESIFLCNN